MGRLMDKLRVSCRGCGHKHIPHRLSGRYQNGSKRRVYLWECKECGHIWKDSAFRSQT